MKRIFVFLLLLSFLLSGCLFMGEQIKEPVTFYYLQSEYQYFHENGVIDSEEKEASGHRRDFPYLMALYLMGPSRDDLRLPVPKGTRIVYSQESPDSIVLKLSDTAQTLNDLEFTLACTCLAMTCFGIADAENVTISSGERTTTINRNEIVLYDSGNVMEDES